MGKANTEMVIVQCNGWSGCREDREVRPGGRGLKLVPRGAAICMKAYKISACEFSRSGEERWSLVLPWENEVRVRNLAEGNGTFSHEELGH